MTPPFLSCLKTIFACKVTKYISKLYDLGCSFFPAFQWKNEGLDGFFHKHPKAWFALFFFCERRFESFLSFKNAVLGCPWKLRMLGSKVGLFHLFYLTFSPTYYIPGRLTAGSPKNHPALKSGNHLPTKPSWLQVQAVNLPGCTNGCFQNRGTPKWMVYNGKPY